MPKGADTKETGNGHTNKTTFAVKAGLAKMLKGGVIMDVVNVEQAKIAEAAGAVAVMALERIPADIRYDGGVARMSDPDMIKSIKAAVTIPVMAKVTDKSHFSSLAFSCLVLSCLTFLSLRSTLFKYLYFFSFPFLSFPYPLFHPP